MSEEPRQSSRRQTERRCRERRVIPYEFGTPEWIAAISQQYLLWPKEDRRKRDRRQRDRRSANRRRKFGKPRTFSKPLSSLQNLLTEEEKQMLHDLLSSDEIVDIHNKT